MKQAWHTIALRGVGGAHYFCGEPVEVVRVKPGDHRLSVQDLLIEAAYVQDPSAFWNRPDGDYLSEEPYRPTIRHYDARTHQTYFLELKQ